MSVIEERLKQFNSDFTHHFGALLQDVEEALDNQPDISSELADKIEDMGDDDEIIRLVDLGELAENYYMCDDADLEETRDKADNYDSILENTDYDNVSDIIHTLRAINDKNVRVARGIDKLNAEQQDIVNTIVQSFKALNKGGN